MVPGVSAKYFYLDSLSHLTAFIYYVLGVVTPFISCLDALTAPRPTGRFPNQDRETQGQARDAGHTTQRVSMRAA